MTRTEPPEPGSLRADAVMLRVALQELFAAVDHLDVECMTEDLSAAFVRAGETLTATELKP